MSPKKLPSKSSPQYTRMDVVIVDADTFYKVPQKFWFMPGNKIPADFAGDARVLVKRGALTAEIPKPPYPTGYYCVLINFSEVAGVMAVPPQAARAGMPGTKPGKKSAKGLAGGKAGSGDPDNLPPIGEQGLVIHVPEQGDTGPDAEGGYYIVPEDVWRKKTVDKKDVPKSAELASLGALCADTDEGFLVNLADLVPPAESADEEADESNEENSEFDQAGKVGNLG